MNVRSFVDTNVLAYTDDQDSPDKQQAALALIESGLRTRNAVISTQILQEYFVAATRKLGVSPVIARRKVELFACFELVQVRLDMIVAAIDLHRLHGFSFWDALVVRAAIESGCLRLLSEDMQHGQRIDGVEIVDPFR